MGAVHWEAFFMTSGLPPLVVVACVLLDPSVVGAQQTTVVSGRVTTKDDGLSLPGATVALPALKLSGLTNQDGRYEINVPGDQAKGQRLELRVTFPGLRDQSVNITLSPGPIAQD